MIKKLTLVVLWLSICAVVGYLSPTLPLVKDIIAIKTVNIKGTDKFKEEDIIDIFKTQNWFFLTEEYVNEKLKRYSFVKRAVIYKPQIGQVDIVVEEKKPFAIVNYNNKSYIVDKDGEIVDKNLLHGQSDLLKVNIVGRSPNFKDLFNQIDFLNRNLSLNPREITISNNTIAITTDNTLIIFSVENLEEELKKMKIFLSKNSLTNYSYLNFSFDEMIITKR